MALFHSTTKTITRSDGENAVAAAAYCSGTRMTCARTGQVFNFTRKKEVSYSSILAPQNSPDWVFDLAQLANAIEVSETRENSQLWREIEIALPIELTPAQHIQLVNDYVQEQFAQRGMVCVIAHHGKTGNPHVHILLTLRDITTDGFGVKRRDWNKPALVTQWREAWAIACNAALEQAGSTERVDHRSNKDRGIDAPATKHLGRRTPWNTERWDERAAFNAWAKTRIELAKIQAEVKRVQSQIIDLTTTIGQALAERDSPKRRANSPAPSAVSTPTSPTAIWTPASELCIAPASAASLLHRHRASKHQSIPAAGTNPSPRPATDLHSAPDLSKETKLC